MFHRFVIAAALVSFTGLAAVAAPRTPLTVVSVTPDGDARGAAQVVLRFSAPVVRFGDPRAAAPAEVRCPVGGTGRWLDERTWNWDFDTPLPSGLRCEVVLQPRLRALSGARLDGVTRYPIESGGPAIVRAEPAAGSESIDEEQIYALLLDGAVDPASVAVHARCEIDGVGEAVPMRVLAGAERARALAGLRAQGWRYAALTNPDEPWRGPDVKAMERVAFVTCARRLPNERKVRLVWDRGIAAPGGPARTDAQVLEYVVRPPFLAKLRCERLVANGDCLPVTPLRIEFTAPVERAAASRVRLVDAASGRTYAAKVGDGGEPTVDSVVFRGPFPANGRLRVDVPRDLVDDAGRRLENAARFPLAVPIADAPPLAKFAAEFGIVERNARPALPVTLRNLDARPGATPAAVPGRVVTAISDADIIAWLGRLQGYTPPTKALIPATAPAAAIAVPRSTRDAEVVGIPLRTPGLHVVELASPRLGAALTGDAAKTWYVRSGALVTNLAVHFKAAAERSLVWVTTLDRATPVAGAAVTVRACDGTLLWQGRTDARGLAYTPALPLERERRCRGFGGTYVAARAGDDVSFTLSDWDRGISPWNFGLDYAGTQPRGPALHAVLDRTLLRAGETVHVKHYARSRTGAGFGPVAASALPDAVVITHAGSGQEWRLPVKFAGGSAEQSWTIPRDAKLGGYALTYWRGANYVGDGGRFAVEEFRLPAQRAVLQLERGPLVAPRTVTADVLVTYLSGGGAAGAPVAVRWRTEPWTPVPAGFDDYRFGAVPIRAGITRAGAEYETDENGEPVAVDAAAGPGAGTVRTLPLTLDAQGSARAQLGDVALDGRPATLVAELEYPDANGQRLSTSTRTPLYPADLLVGLRAPRWPRAGQPFGVETVVLGVDERPRAGRRVVVEAWSRTVYSYRKRLFGGFYAYDNQAEVRKVGTLCEATTDARGRARCDAQLDAAHAVILRATVQDDAGRTAEATDEIWLADVEAWWGGDDSERIDLIPERRRYEPGETARLEARVPFRRSTALVTVEREGVLYADVVPLDAKSPNVRVPIARGWSPNVFVSVLAVRGRASEPAPTALVDLGKPTFRLGYAALQVGRAPHELAVTVTPERDVYPTRATARVRIAARTPDGRPAAGAEVALAAVDEALLELSPNPTWQLLDAMLAERPLNVRTATAHLQVIGKRHYGRKAVAPGGGGGNASTRELFDTLLAWRGRIVLDARGEATVDVPLNDSLSAFRIAALGAHGDDLFGTGTATVRTHRDLMLFGGLAEVVRDGDSQLATATLRNAADRPLDVRVTASVTPTTPNASGTPLELPPQVVTLRAGEARELAWPLVVPAGATRLGWQLRATAAGGAEDALSATQRVLPGRAEAVVQQATLLRLDQPRRLALAKPRGALPDGGAVRIAYSASLAGSLDGVRAWFERYPYTCLEQQASRAVGLEDAAAWTRIVTALPAYLDADGLARFFPDAGRGSDVLTAYLLQIADAAGREIPMETRVRMLDALVPIADGTRRPAGAGLAGEATLRRLQALEALARHGRATPAMLQSLQVTPESWPSSALVTWLTIVGRMPDLPDREALLAEARGLLRTRLQYSATRLVLSGERDEGHAGLLDSPDRNAARALLAALDAPDFGAETPRLAAGLVARQQRGHWDTTLANAWGAVALRRYAQAYEREAVAGTTAATLGAEMREHAWSGGDGAVSLPWPDGGRATLQMTHAGAGAPWAVVQSIAAVPLARPERAGYGVVREVTAVRQAVPGRWTRGDLVRVRLELDARQDMAWVAVTDPIPAGSAVLGGTARSAEPLVAADARGAAAAVTPAAPTYVERGQASWRAYFEFLPRGRWQLEYTLRLNAAGTFQLPATRVEAMYAPDVYGAAPNAPVVVRPE
jgi:uncharacterized protein YfaS (alpha-2-macroglobulin family)